MDTKSIRSELDALIQKTDSYNSSALPSSLIEKLSRWKWGTYGWVSPASLMVTAAWRKYYYPDIDCCRIWADDEKKRPIAGGYSIRSEDESVTIPLLAKYDLCQDFCSPNSGMQGSRAIEKMRNLKRLNVDFDNAQRTLFDLRLFAEIMNEINDLNETQLLELIKYFICIAKGIKAHRDEVNASIACATNVDFSILDFLAKTHDPEFTKCVVAACFEAIYKPAGLKVAGAEDYKTAADARAGKPGDLTIERNGKYLLAIEVKDKTQSIDWNNIERASRILARSLDLNGFIFVLENRDAATNSLVHEMVTSSQLATGVGRKIAIMSLFALYHIARVSISESDLNNIVGQYIVRVPAIKPETKESWLRAIGA